MSWYSKIYVWVREFRKRRPIRGWLLTKLLNVMLVCQFIMAGYIQVMYCWAVCYRMLDNKIQAVAYICVFEALAFLSMWSFFATITTEVCKVPSQYYTDKATDANLKAATPYDGKRYLPDTSNQLQIMQQKDMLRAFCASRSIYCLERDHFAERIRYCYECGLVKPDRTHHCQSCGFCVVKFDHHCPWINHCVNYNNYKYFLLYLIYTEIFLIWTVGTSLEGFVRFFIRARWQEDLPPFLMICSAIVACICFMYTPLGEMFNYHRGLVILNETTCEQAKIPKIDGDPKADYNMGTCENLRQVFGWGYWYLPLSAQVIDGLHYKIRYTEPAKPLRPATETTAVSKVSVDMS